MEILDPTLSGDGLPSVLLREAGGDFAYAPRPDALDGLRIGLVENTKLNSEELLLKLAARLESRHGMTVAHLVHKPQRAPIRDDQIAELTGVSDFVICGVGD